MKRITVSGFFIGATVISCATRTAAQTANVPADHATAASVYAASPPVSASWPRVLNSGTTGYTIFELRSDTGDGHQLAARSAVEPQTEFGASTSAKAAREWNTDPKHWDQPLRRTNDSPGLRIGKSDAAISGPTIEGLRPGRSSPDRNLGQKPPGLPIIRPFVPQPMPSVPSGGGKYFAWGESSWPWASIAAGTSLGSALNPINQEPQNSLISIGF